MAPPRLDSVLSFSHGTDEHRPTTDEADMVAFSDGGSDDEDAGFEFAFAPPLTAAGHDAEGILSPADDLFAHGRIVPAYPVFDRRHLPEDGDHDLTAAAQPQASTAPPSPDTYCAWAPRSAPGSPAREGPFPKSASTGEARRFWRLRDLVGGSGGRSHSDGKEKFVFLQPAAAAPPFKMSAKAPVEGKQASSKPSAPLQPQQPQKQSKKGGKTGAATEMDMATAHKLFYGKQGVGGDRRTHSYLPYRPAIVGFFTTAHALGRSHHPY